MLKVLFSSQIVLFCLLLSVKEAYGQGGLVLNEQPPLITLEGESGGRVDGTPWSSKDLLGKVHILFYVAPSKKELNREATDAISAADFPKDKYSSVAVVNMAASAWPNFLIASKIASSQKEFPRTIYVKDVNRAFVNKWQLKDDSSVVVIFDRTGKVIFRYDGKLPAGEIEKMLSILRKAMGIISTAPLPTK